jgi:hypothetical protein
VDRTSGSREYPPIFPVACCSALFGVDRFRHTRYTVSPYALYCFAIRAILFRHTRYTVSPYAKPLAIRAMLLPQASAIKPLAIRAILFPEPLSPSPYALYCFLSHLASRHTRYTVSSAIKPLAIRAILFPQPLSLSPYALYCFLSHQAELTKKLARQQLPPGPLQVKKGGDAAFGSASCPGCSAVPPEALRQAIHRIGTRNEERGQDTAPLGTKNFHSVEEEEESAGSKLRSLYALSMSAKLATASSNLLPGHVRSSLHSAWNLRPVFSNDLASAGRLSKSALGTSIPSCEIVAVT